jgi:hypothetical protein
MQDNKETGLLHDYEAMKTPKDLHDPIDPDDISQEFIPEPPKEQLKQPLLPEDIEKSDQNSKEDPEKDEFDQVIPLEKQLKVEPKTVPSGKELLYQLGDEATGDSVDTTDEKADQSSEQAESRIETPGLTSHASTDTIPSSTPKTDSINDIGGSSSTSPSSFSSVSSENREKDLVDSPPPMNPMLTTSKTQEQESSVMNDINKENSSVNL